MKMMSYGSVLVVLAAILSLAGCGGSGSALRSAADQLDNAANEQGWRGKLPGKETVKGVDSAAKAEPRFGSVYQSSQQQGTNVAWSGSHVTLTAGSLFTLNSANEAEVPKLEGAAGNPKDLTGDSLPGSYNSGKQYELYKEDNGEFSATVVRVFWDAGDIADYVAGGYWFYSPDLGVADPTVHVGAFVDGPGIDDLTAAITSTATGATYSGDFGGIFGYELGQLPVFAEVEGTATLSANFETATVSGEIADLELTGVSENILGEVELDLQSTTFDMDTGQFDPGTVKVIVADEPQDTSTGNWGGRFSEEDNADNDPVLAAGTAGASWNGGSIVGAFIAEKQ